MARDWPHLVWLLYFIVTIEDEDPAGGDNKDERRHYQEDDDLEPDVAEDDHEVHKETCQEYQIYEVDQ